jgi:predicted O-methyltransferase YrrM
VTSYNDQLSQYINDLFARQDDILNQIRENIPIQGLPAISIQPEEGLFLQFLVKAIGAKKVIEIGTLGGYSGVWLARGLSPGGKLITLEKEPQHAAVAREHFHSAGLQDIVEVRVGVAVNILMQLTIDGPFDFVFIDADKSGYPVYLDWAIENLRIGGIVAAHNAFRSGSIIDPTNLDETTEEIRKFNQRVASEPRLLSTIFPAGDGTVIGVKIW